ncbi:lipid-binding protein [Flavobacterium sp. A45]|uniref:lipid-binding protein n=1 Tax=Flavobacterium sp. A45 TaxID=1945862 RepID=UPI00098548A7|nr:lipid-binding protein [Flavobacterium sp. A45]OOG76226.1 hypothetical protein B0E44_03885 [Flavobacterium sp. A45]
MNKLKNNIIKVLFGILIMTSFSSCDEGGDPNPGGTTTEQFAGDWYIDISDASGILAQHVHHYTYNTAANDNTMWIDDHGDGYEIKCKMTINSDGTFSATASPNLLDLDATGKPQSTVTITEGKIEKGAAESKGGHKVDKISFKAEFSYDPGTIITYEGHKRTGFKEDEY